VNFVDSSSDPDGDPLSRAWDFGDGDSQNFGATPTHTFERRGRYTVRLVVSDPQGASDTTTRVITVGTRADDDAPVVRITERPEHPTHARDAHFRFTSSEAGAGFICTLDGDSRPCGPGDPVAGNGVVGSVDYPNLSTGPHSFRVSMTDASGNTGSDSFSWTILPRGSEFDHIVISPSSSTIDLGDAQNYTAEAFDTNGDSMGDVTAHTRFTIQPSGSCEGNTCRPTAAGTHTVVGKYTSDSDSATLEVVDAPAAPQCPAYALSFHSRPPGSIAAGHPFNVQVRVEVLGGGDPGGTLAITLGGAPFSTGETSETWNGNGTVVFNGLKIEQPGSYDVIATAPCARASDPAHVSVTEGPSGAGGAVAGLVVALPVTEARRRRR
jgi:PKD repeat protein